MVIDAKHTTDDREFHLELTVEADVMKDTVKSGEPTAAAHLGRLSASIDARRPMACSIVTDLSPSGLIPRFT